MIEEMTIQSIKNVLGTSMSVISSEHFFSAGLSSPWSVAKFAATEEDHQEVWHYFDESARTSMLFGGILSYSMKSLWPIVGSAATVLYYKNLYKSALDKAKQNTLKKNLDAKGLSNTIDDITRTGSVKDIQDLLNYVCTRK